VSLNRVVYYRIALVVSACALVVWQYTIATSKETRVPQRSGPTEISFTMNNGATVSLPDTSNRYTALVFWRVASDRSLQQLQDAMEARKTADIDTLIDFYFVNLGDSVSEIRNAVNFDDYSVPYACNPTGTFFDRYQIRALPLTLILSADGSVVDGIEGYQQGSIAGALQTIIMLNKTVGRSGQFRFDWGTKNGGN
jgi:hypothetical protein